ncbi:hypothetical protein DY000_02060322 [Brassica cretica]|uniref:Uncharacterized protein n=1 Tax=Brassica cretica TaxID=69181 RepID=A0ABQ7ATP1_BRACR|nr:hypothetical protein DY000_02060322 [Brassica cretica]
MVTPIETKQELIRFDHRRGSYVNGMKAACSVQLAKLAERASWTNRLVQLTRSASWTGQTRRAGKSDFSFSPTRPFGELDCSFGSTRPFGELDWSNSLSGPVGLLVCWTARLVQLARSASRTGQTRRAGKLDCSFVQLARSASWTGQTRRVGKLEFSFGPTRLFGELDQMDELDGLLDLILPFGGLDVGVSLSRIRCPGLRASFLEGLSYISREFSDFDSVVTDFDSNNTAEAPKRIVRRFVSGGI